MITDESGYTSGVETCPAPHTHLVGDTIVCDSIPIGYANRKYTELRSEPSTEFFIRVYGPHHANHPKVHPLDPALIGIAEEIKESGGHWRPCSGCYDTEDGHPTQKYDFSPALQTPIGCGCTECGGLGATWEHYTAEEVEQMVRGEVDDEIEILSRLSNGDTVVYSQDGECGWFTKGDRAFVGDVIISLRKNGFLLRKCDDEENYRGMSEYDTISDVGRAHLAATTEGQNNG